MVGKLFEKYAKRGKQLTRIIKLDCHIYFRKLGILESVGIIKITKSEVIDNNPNTYNVFEFN
jgi:hypothetical protein